jgi:hypothetical protein
LQVTLLDYVTTGPSPPEEIKSKTYVTIPSPHEE